MKNVRIIYSEEFVDHLESIVNHLETKNPQSANKFRENVNNSLQNLKLFPEQWGKVTSNVDRLDKYRKIVLLYDYLIFYFFDESLKTIYVVDILNGKQDYPHLLK